MSLTSPLCPGLTRGAALCLRPLTQAVKRDFTSTCLFDNVLLLVYHTKIIFQYLTLSKLLSWQLAGLKGGVGFFV